MNKKVLTLCASFLLAGGLTSQAFAVDFKTAAANPDQYYYVHVNRGSLNVNGAHLDVNGTQDPVTGEWNDDIRFSNEENRSTWWRVETVKQTVNGVESVVGYKLINALTGKPLSVTEGNTTYDTFIYNSGQAMEFVASINSSTGAVAGGKWYTGSDGTGITDGTTPAGVQTWFYDLEAVPVQNLSADQANLYRNGYFGLQFGYIKDNKYVNYESIEGVEALTGELEARATVDVFTDNNIKAYNGSDINADSQNDGSYFLYNKSADAYVVLLKEKWSKNNTDLLSGDGKGYKFALMTAKQIIEDQKLAADKQTIATWSFNVNMPVVKDYAPLEILARGVTYTNASKTEVTEDLELLIAEVNGVNYLTTNRSVKPNEAEEPTYTNVRFGDSDYIDMSQFYGWAITIKGLEGAGVKDMTVRPDVDVQTNIADAEAVWTKAEYVSFSRPEAQWIVTSQNGTVVLTNRETKATLRWNEAFNMIGGGSLALREEGNDVYSYKKDNTTYKFEIKKVAELGGETFDHYGMYDQDDTEIGTTRTYKVTFADAFGTTSYIGMDGKGNVLLTRDESEAINFDLVKTQTTDTLKNDGTVAENAKKDVFYIINDIMAQDKDGNWYYKAAGDTLSYYRYKLAYGEDKFLSYDDNAKDFVLAPETRNKVNTDKNSTVKNAADKDRVNYATSDLADNFIVKLKENGKVNIVKVINYEMEDILAGKYYNGDETNKYVDIETLDGDALFAAADDWANYNEGEKVLANGKMMFFDFNNAEVQEQQNIYAWNANAQLTIVDKKFDSYRYFATPDTMEFYRVEYADEFLYEKVQNGINFLGMTYDRKTYNPAIYVDTAYIQNTKKPTYLLALAPEIEPSHKYCPTHGIDPDASVCVPEHQTTIPGYVTARYLVSFTDSVAKHAAELKNPYLEDGKYTKLGFVDAVHGVNDLNIIQNGDTVKTYELTDAAAKAALNPVEFAFRIANQETKSFYIESVDNGKVSYIRWQNGVPVLTTDITDAEEFNVRETSENPTANEEISAEEATVSVVATDGAVIVKGAEGKNVIVSTILGKVVANETVNSDNETIAAPAGIVVVSVDGESFKVVVK